VPAADEPRITVRVSKADHAVLEAAAKIAGVKVGTWMRDAAVEKARTLVAKPSKVQAVKPQVTDALHAATVQTARNVEGVKTARDLMLERQRRLNEGKG
jgi:uncharacterized protein (DUF1778 family)